MPDEAALGLLAQIPSGEGRVFLLNGARIAVFHTRDGNVFATQADCPHRGGPLADGLTDETTVVCPLHDRVYDLRTGAGVGTDCSIRVFPVRVNASGVILIEPQAEPAMATAP
jgi:nitrite reductase (NADH) small subunit